MKKIESMADLKTEKKLLRLRAKTLEGNIISEWGLIKNSLTPVTMVLNGLSKTVTGDKRTFISDSLYTGLDLVLRNVFLRNRGFLVKWIVPYLVNNLTGNYVKNHSTDIMGWLKRKVTSVFNKNGKDNHYDKSTADINAIRW